MKAKACLRIATRKSPLAYWQANFIKQQLEQRAPQLRIELLPFVTEGDRRQQIALNKIGGKGLFVKELEKALLSGQADLAVHSMKDVPMHLEPGLFLGAICRRDDPRDVLVALPGMTLNTLPQGACLGSSSLRRQAQIHSLRPDIAVKLLRGNVETRLAKWMQGEYDAIVLAAAGLLRLQKTAFIQQYLNIEDFLSAPGQGALGVECREDDKQVRALIELLNHAPTQRCVTAERALSRTLNGGCQVPIAAYATCIDDQSLHLQGLVATPDGKLQIRAQAARSIEEAEELGVFVAQRLLAQGAAQILANLR